MLRNLMKKSEAAAEAQQLALALAEAQRRLAPAHDPGRTLHKHTSSGADDAQATHIQH